MSQLRITSSMRPIQIPSRIVIAKIASPWLFISVRSPGLPSIASRLKHGKDGVSGPGYGPNSLHIWSVPRCGPHEFKGRQFKYLYGEPAVCQWSGQRGAMLRAQALPAVTGLANN